MKKTIERIISTLVTVAICAAFVPSALAVPPDSLGWTVVPFEKNDFRIYNHTAVDSADASIVTGKEIDLSDPLHFYMWSSGISYDGFAVMRVDGPISKTVPAEGATITDDGYYQLTGSMTSGSHYTYFRNPDAETLKNYDENGYYTEETYEDGTSKYDHGMYLQYTAGSDKYYIEPGYYRFVYFQRQSQSIKYSGVYQITDKNGVYQSPGSADISLSVNNSATNTIFSDDTFDVVISGLKAADGSDVSLANANVSKIEFLTNYWAIPSDGSSIDSVVSYELNQSCLMYDGTAMDDDRTLEKSGNAITLKNCTAKHKKWGILASLCYSGEDRKFRARVTATVVGEEKVFMSGTTITVMAVYENTTVITKTLPNATLGTEYNGELTGVAGDKSSLTWTVDSGSLPTGLMLAENGKITGMPTTAGEFNFTIKATAADGTSDTKDFTITVSKKQQKGYWSMSVTAISYYRKSAASYSFTAIPMSGGDVLTDTPLDDTEATVQLDYGALQNDSTVTVTQPSTGVTAAVDADYNTIMLSFDNSVVIPQEGIKFTVNNVINPDSSYINASITSSVNAYPEKWETEMAQIEMSTGYAHMPLTSADGILLTVDDWNNYENMNLRAIVTKGSNEHSADIGSELTAINNLNIGKGDEYTVRLEAMDSKWVWHTYYESETLIGDGEGNRITIHPNPSAEDTLTGYTLKTTLDGTPNNINTNLYQDTLLSNHSGYYWLANTNNLTATANYWTFNSVFPGYDVDGNVTANGTEITVDYPKLNQTATINGTVKNTAEETLANASVVASTIINGETITVNTVTDSNGQYTLSNMYNGKQVEITAWLDGYEESSVTMTAENTATADITLTPTSSIYVTIDDGQSVTKPVFTVYDSSNQSIATHRFTSGSRFTLALPSSASTAEGTSYKVKMTSEDTSGQIEGTALFDSNKSANVSLSPSRLGYIDWSEIDGVDYRVLVYKDGSYYKSFNASEWRGTVPAGEYTVYISNGYEMQSGDPSENVTVEAGKTVSLTIEPPSSDTFIVASVKAPKMIEKGKYYEISGVIESETDKDGNPFYGLFTKRNNGSEVIGYKINGSYVGLTGSIDYVHKGYAGSYYSFVDWSFPLSYTLYIRQGAELGDYQSVTMLAGYGSSRANDVTIGTVTTKSVPGITLQCPEVIGAKTVKTTIGGTGTDTLEPGDIEFTGTAPANAAVRIYDNDTLIAIARADSKGNYSGMAQCAMPSRGHTLRAEVTVDLNGEDTAVSAERSFTYSPTGPRLTGLWLNNTSLSITGGMTAFYPTRDYTYEAAFENDDRLADMTVTDQSEEPGEDGNRATLTGKVFFLVKTTGGSHTLIAQKASSGKWTATSSLDGSDPLDVKVLYEEKNDLTAPSVTVTDVNEGNAQTELDMDNVYEAKVKDGETISWDDKQNLLSLMGISENEPVTDDTADTDPNYTWILNEEDETVLASFDADNAVEISGLDNYFTLASDTKSTSDLINSIATELSSNEAGIVDINPNTDGVKAVNAMSINDANAPGGAYYEQRTWTDSPTWTESGVKWRIEELTANGYKSNSVRDRASGRQYLYFKNTLFYDKYGNPVPLPYANGYNKDGIPGLIVSELLFKDGKMVGSSLDVEYMYDVKAGKWLRSQTAIIPPNATSPLHTAPNQIPNKEMRPYRYVSAAHLSSFGASDFALMASSRKTGGLSIKIKLDKVSEKTYSSATCSVAGFACGKLISAENNLHKYVDFDNAKWGKYSLSLEEQGNTVYWAAVGNNAPDSVLGSILPTGRDSGVTDMLGLRKALEANYKYYAKLEKNDVNKYIAAYGKRDTRELLEALGDLEYAIEMADIQDAFTNNVTKELTCASGFVGLFGGPVGTEASFAIDLMSVLISAANDTNNAEVMDACEKFQRKYNKYMATDKADKDKMKKAEQEKKDYNNSMGFDIYEVNNDVFDDPFDDGDDTTPTAETVPVHDPSGVVYEGVIENRVEDATVTLYKYDAENAVPTLHDDSAYLGQQNPLTTDENGFYRWDVPEGEWYVTASKDGYIAGNSGSDRAAMKSHTVGGETMNFLPVLPPQLDVNIPLVDKTAPEVEDVVYTPEGIYVTFTKYMVDTGYNDNGSVLVSNNYTLTGEDGPITDFSVRSVVQGHVPSNIDKNEQTYTKTVRLVPAWGTEFEGDISLTVSGSVKSYADTALGVTYEDGGTAESGEIELTVTQTGAGAVIKNNAFHTGKAAIIVAAYDKDGVLTDVSSEEYEFSVLDEKTVNFTGTLTHKVFVWDSLEGMKPLDTRN